MILKSFLGLIISLAVSHQALALIGGKKQNISAAVFIEQNLCSGVLIAKNRILTAGHCLISDLEVGYGLKAGSQLDINGARGQRLKVTVAAVEAHPAWLMALKKYQKPSLASDAPETLDLGIIVLAQDLPLATADLPSEELAPMNMAVMSGAGCEFREGFPSYYFKTALVDVLEFDGTKLEVGIKEKSTGLEVGLCHGDSGSGLFLANKSGKLQKPLVVVGINSALKAAPTEFVAPALVVDLRQKDLKKWITEAAGAASQD